MPRAGKAFRETIRCGENVRSLSDERELAGGGMLVAVVLGSGFSRPPGRG